jgi:hypothetical protein
MTNDSLLAILAGNSLAQIWRKLQCYYRGSFARSFSCATYRQTTGTSQTSEIGFPWRIARPDVPPEEWATDDFKLVAIEHCLLPDTRALLGTRLKYSFALLLNYHPKLQPAFHLSFPDLR